MNRLRVAAVQAAPVFGDLDASLTRAEQLVADAAGKGARFVVFPETWLPGYPAWLDVARDAALWDHPPVKKLFAALHANSVEIPGPVVDRLGACAREHGVVLNMSVHERERGTLYNTMLTFDADGTLSLAHRKLMPTYTERLVWGQGDGKSLRGVDTQAGRVGGLICWEHWMPLARQALHDSGEQIHVAAWPQVKEMHLIASRHYAFEGRCYVIAAGSMMPASDLPAELDTIDVGPWALRGGSAIIAPDGAVVAGPVWDEETILVADLDLARIAEESMTLDVSGHYARPDLFSYRRP
ncbi:MAG: carbon-nitrogen hydrolase family protein [Planctomycetota bacterium]